MELVLRFQSTGAVPGRGDPLRLRGGSITIGRGQDNDYPLPDPDRLLSKRHCAIEDHGDAAVVVDFSTNGTFLNYGKIPIGQVPTRLNHGDILSLGPYELLVEICAAADAPDAAGADIGGGGHVGPEDLRDDPLGEDDGDFLDDLLGGPTKPEGATGVNRPELGEDGVLPPLGPDEGSDAPDASEHGPTPSQHGPAIEDHMPPPRAAAQPIPEDWDEDFLAGIGEDAAPPEAETPPATDLPGEISEPDRARQSNAADTADPGAPVAPPAATAAPVPPSGAAADMAGSEAETFAAFLRGAGLADLDVPPERHAETMERAGRLMRALVAGLRETLMTRSSIKSEFRIAQTVIAAGGNNPLKFSISEDQAIESLVHPRTRGYMDPVSAAEEALRDVRAHEVAMLSGMEAAMRGVLQSLAPQELEKQIESSGGFGSLLKGRKARYWEIYETIYARISDEAESDFQELFGKEFARAYEEQMRKLK